MFGGEVVVQLAEELLHFLGDTHGCHAPLEGSLVHTVPAAEQTEPGDMSLPAFDEFFLGLHFSLSLEI